jgi:hypothetical protein
MNWFQTRIDPLLVLEPGKQALRAPPEPHAARF